MHPYFDAALERQLAEVLKAPAGSRNDQLNRAVFSVAQLLHLAPARTEDVVARFTEAGCQIGLPPREIHATLSSGIQHGLANPYVPADDATDPYLGAANAMTRIEAMVRDGKLAGTKSDEERRAEAVAAWEAGERVKDTPAAKYLALRGIKASIGVETARWNGELYDGSIVFPARGPDGEVFGIQAVPLTADGKKRGGSKYSSGLIKAHPMRIAAADGNDGPLIICEGPEDAVTLRAATGCETWAVLGKGVMGHAPVPDGRAVVLCQDADAARQVEEFARALVRRGCNVNIARPMASMADANDILQQAGADAVKAWVDSAEAFIVPDLFDRWQVIDEADLPARDFIYGTHYIRQFASCTIAPGGLGKSLMVIAEAVSMATGHDILQVGMEDGSARVVYFNAEDPLDEIQRRVLAVCKQYGIRQQELVPNLFLASGRERDLLLATGQDGDIATETFERLRAFCRAWQPDVIIFDPLANMTDAPETNDVFRRLGKALSMLADECQLAIEVVHHTRKLGGREAEAEDARGGSALIGAVRSARVLNPMTRDEADKAGLASHIDHFRVEDGKANLARRSAKARWMERQSVLLGNGDYVGCVVPWAWPDAFDGVSADDAARVRAALSAGQFKASSQAAEWAGREVARVLGLNIEDKADRARVAEMMRTWITSGVLAEVQEHDGRRGRAVRLITGGSVNPQAMLEG
jgi:RecA-family ATPase